MVYKIGRCRISEFLLAIGKTQQDIINETGIPKSTISAYATNERSMSLLNAIILTDWFNQHLPRAIIERDLYTWISKGKSRIGSGKSRS